MNRTLRNRFVIVLTFFAIWLVGDRILARLLHQMVTRSNLRFSQVYRGGMNNDVIFLGSSRGVNSFYAPKMSHTMGKSCLNLSYNGFSAEIVEAILYDYLDRNAPPRVIFLEVSCVNADSSGPIQSIQRLYPDSPRLARICQRYNQTSYIYSNVSHLYRYNSEMFLRTLYYMDRSDQTWINRYTIQPNYLQQVKDGPGEMFPAATEENLAALNRIVKETRQRGIRCELILGPLLPEYREKLTNLKSWLATVQAAVGSDVTIHDYSGIIVDREAFADRVHLNYHGACMLIPYLVGKKQSPVFVADDGVPDSINDEKRR